MEMEITVVPFHGQGHILPSAQLSLHLAYRNIQTTLLLPWTSHPTPPIPHHRLLRVAHLPPSSNPHDLNDDAFAAYLSDRPRPACVVLDVMMSRLAPVFRRFGVPVVCLFTSGAFSAAANHAVFSPLDDGKVEIIASPYLPEDLIADLADLFLLRRHGGGGGDNRRLGPPPGSPPPWLDNAEGSVGVLVNTTLDLEGPFLDYVARAVGKPVWGVGPLLPAGFWSPSPSRGDGESAAVIRGWLDSKPVGSVVYVAFGTEVSPSQSELRELAAALEASNQFYIWARRRRADRHAHDPARRHAHDPPPPQPNTGLDETEVVKEGKGMVVRGWAPQLMILRHPSTGVFVSHCGWNSTVEAMACGVPMLCWPIRGDQPYNARLIAGELKVGHMVARAGGGEVRKEGIVRGIERVLGDSDARERAAEMGRRLETGFPTSSSSSLDAFSDFINRVARRL